jgi:hypothetical protein
MREGGSIVLAPFLIISLAIITLPIVARVTTPVVLLVIGPKVALALAGLLYCLNV